MAKIVMPILGVVVTSTALVVAACSEPTRPVFDPALLVQGTGSADELHGRWERWRTVGPTSYGYELHRGCFCITEYVTPAWVEVRDGRVTSARALANGTLANDAGVMHVVPSLVAR